MAVMPPPVISLTETAGVCAILEGPGYDMATALMAWEILKPIDRLATTPSPDAQLHSFFMVPAPSLFLPSKVPIGWSEL